MQAQRARVGDQRAEQAAAFRPVMDPGNLRLIQANRDELGQPAALADDAQRAVPGGYQLDGGLDDLPQHHFELEVAADHDHGFEERMGPVPGVENRLQPRLQLHQKVVEPQVRQQRTGILAVHRLYLGLVARHVMIVRGRAARRKPPTGPPAWACPGWHFPGMAACYGWRTRRALALPWSTSAMASLTSASGRVS